MSQYSEIVGSFLRNGPFPLEADYVFESEEALIQFYSEPENQAVVHQGWFKIVGEGENQALYWVVKEGDDLKFVKLLEKIDRDSIYSDLKELSEKINNEIREREEADKEIWGDKEGVISDLNNIEELSKAVDELRTKVGDAISALSSIVSGDNSLELEEIEDYLKQLDYPSIKDLSEVLYKFLQDIDESNDKINTLPELQDFLDGYKDTDKLKDILQNLSNSILGNVEPGTTLESLRRHLLDLIQSLITRCYNLLTELDLTLVGVGLSGDGAYNADKETYYLKDATSVMNALKTLDRLLHRQANVEYKDSDTIHFDPQILEDENLLLVTADVKIADDSDIIIIDELGIYHKVDLSFENGKVALLVNGKERTSFNIGLDPLLEDGYYDKTTEKIVLIFKLHNGGVQRIEIPAEDLIAEWTTDNTFSVTLNRTRVVDGTDVLTADLNISQNKDNGIITKSDGVFASKNAKDLVYKDKSVESAIEDVETSIELIEEDLGDKLDSSIYDADKSISLYPKANLIVYTTIDNEILENTSPKIESNIYYKDRGYGVITLNTDVTETLTSTFTDGPSRLKSIRYSRESSVILNSEAFYNYTLVEYIDIPRIDGTEISWRAFRNCKSLKTFTIPNNITLISSESFFGAESLTEIIIPDSVTYINTNAFNGCSSIKNVVIPKDVTVVNNGAFKNCKSLSSVIIESTVLSIVSELCFMNCYSLNYIQLPSQISIIRTSAFRDCEALTNIKLPSSLRTLENSCFRNTSLKSVELPTSVTSIQDSVFYNVPLEYIKLQSSLTTVGEHWEARPAPFIYDTSSSRLYAIVRSDRLQSLILRYNGVLKDVDTYVSTFISEKGQEVPDDEKVTSKEVAPISNIAPLIDVDTYVGTPNNWLKIYVPENRLKEYRETYPTLKGYLHPITGEDIYALKDDVDKKIEEIESKLPSGDVVGVTWGRIGIKRPEPTTIRLNQTISDPNQMVSGEFGKDGTPETNTISWIRANSHRYVGNYDETQGMILRQLDDNDSTRYTDGSDASEDIKGTNGGDVFMKMPTFWFKGVKVDDNPDIVDILFSAKDPKDESWTKWDGDILIGAYEAVCQDTGNNTNGELYSRSGVTPTASISQNNFKAKARNRSNNDDHFMIVIYEAHMVMALLYIAYYGDNMNAQTVIGSGTSSYPKVAGQTNINGMNDTKAENSRSINFWGLENWWGDLYEWMDNLVTADNSGTININNYDGETERQVKGYASSSSNYITKMVLGEKLDLIPSALGGSQTTYYCDHGRVTTSAGLVALRSSNDSNAYGGPFYLIVNDAPSHTDGVIGSRLLYYGRVTIAKNSTRMVRRIETPWKPIDLQYVYCDSNPVLRTGFDFNICDVNTLSQVGKLSLFGLNINYDEIEFESNACKADKEGNIIFNTDEMPISIDMNYEGQLLGTLKFYDISEEELIERQYKEHENKMLADNS